MSWRCGYQLFPYARQHKTIVITNAWRATHARNWHSRTLKKLNHGVVKNGVKLNRAGGQHETMPERMKERYALVER